MKAQYIKRGGLRSGPLIKVEDRLSKIKQLRADAQKEQAAKVQEGKDQAAQRDMEGEEAMGGPPREGTCGAAILPAWPTTKARSGTSTP